MAADKIIIYHNPRCSKSREALGLLNEANCEIEVVEYLKDTPSFDSLKALIAKLGIEPQALLRTGETVYKESFKGKTLSEDEWIQVMVENPVLIERPIVIHGNKAVIGRPPVLVKTIM
jgi:arsenate reductase (glutaredoxin)